MKKIKILVIVFSTVLLFTACQKEESIENYDSISGVLTPGENVTAEDLAGIKLYLGKLPDDTDPASFTLQTGQVESAMTQDLNADGSFMFSNLANGNYVLLIEPGYTFLEDDYLNISIDGITEPAPIQQNVSRAEPDNTPIGADPFVIQLVSYALYGLIPNYTVKDKQFHCVVDNQTDISSFSLIISAYNRDVEIDTWTSAIMNEGETNFNQTFLDVYSFITLSYKYEDEINKIIDNKPLCIFGGDDYSAIIPETHAGEISDFEIEKKIKTGFLKHKTIKVVFHKIGTGNYSITLSEM